MSLGLKGRNREACAGGANVKEPGQLARDG